MTDTKLKKEYAGEKFTIIHCEGAIESFYSALASVQAGRRQKFTRALIQQITRLADGHRMSQENFPQEGALPNKVGQSGSKKFNALKKIPIRGYCWLSEIHKNTFFISHYIAKKQNKLDPADTNKVGANWRRIEVDGDEC